MKNGCPMWFFETTLVVGVLAVSYLWLRLLEVVIILISKL